MKIGMTPVLRDVEAVLQEAEQTITQQPRNAFDIKTPKLAEKRKKPVDSRPLLDGIAVENPDGVSLSDPEEPYDVVLNENDEKTAALFQRAARLISQ